MGRNSTKKTPKKTPAEKTKKYVVEKILAKRLIGNTTEYLIKWKSYSHSENSWEPAANCVDCPAVIKQFEEKQSKKVGKKRSAPVAASQNSGPPAKKTRTSASAPAKSTPRTRRRTSTASTQRSETPSSSAGLIHLKRNRRNASSTPKLVPQQVSFEFSSPPNNSALSPVNYSPNEVPVSTHYRTAERLESTLPLETTRDGSSSSDIIFVETVKKNDQSLPATQPVNDDENLPTNEMLTPQGEDNVKNDQSLPATQPVNDDENLPTNEMLTPHVEDDVSVVPSYFKTMRNADKNIEMAEELLKCPDKFYVFISLGILKDNLHDNHKELLYAIEQLNNKGDKLGLIADKVEKIQVTHREIEAALENLLPSSRLAQHASPPQDDETILDPLSKNEAAEKESATDIDTQVLDTVLDVADQSVAVEDDKGTQLLGTVPDLEDQSAAVEDDKGTQHLDTVQDETVLDSISKNEVAKEESVINLDTTVLDTVQDVEDQSDAAVEDDKGTQLLDTVEDETVLDSTPKNEVGEEKSAIDVDTQLLDTVQDVEDQSAAAVEDDKDTQLLDSTPKNEVAEEKSADVDTQVLDTVQDEKINNIENLGAAESAKTIEGESKSNEEKVGEEL